MDKDIMKLNTQSIFNLYADEQRRYLNYRSIGEDMLINATFHNKINLLSALSSLVKIPIYNKLK